MKIRQLLYMPARPDLGWLLLRLALCFGLLRGHGLRKVLHFREEVAVIPDPLGLGGEISTVVAIFSGVVCALLIAAGLLTRLACAGILATTLTGFLLVHGADAWEVRDVPFIYSAIAFAITVGGPGRYAVDHVLFANKHLAKTHKP